MTKTRTNAFKAVALSILVGFVILSVFGLVGPRSSEGDSLLSCVATSAAAVACGGGTDAISNVVHEIASFHALTSIVLSVLVLAVLALAVLFTLTVVTANPPSFVFASQAVENPRQLMERRWLSLFESSPGK